MGLRAERCCLIRAGGNVGTGYCVGDAVVLTAAHIIDGQQRITVTMDPDGDNEHSSSGRCVWARKAVGVDIALLELANPPAGGVDPPAIGGVRETATILHAVALGFPRWKLRSDSIGQLRDSAHIEGRIPVFSNRRTRTLEFIVAPPEHDDDPDVSPWAGMSGAAVWSDGLLIGIVAEHYRREGPGRLTVMRMDFIADSLTDEDRDTLRTLIAFPPVDGRSEMVPRTPTDHASEGFQSAVAEEVRGWVELGRTQQAINRLLDLVKEVGTTDQRNDALKLAGALSRLKRTGKTDSDGLRTEGDIEDRVLKLVDEIDALQRSPRVSSNSPTRTGSELRDVSGAEISNAGQSLHVTAGRVPLEEERRLFRQRHGLPELTDSPVVVQCTLLGKSFGRTQQRVAFKDVTLKLNAGEILGILGRNGAGKSTLLSVLSGDLISTTGELLYPFFGQHPGSLQIMERVAYVPQFPISRTGSAIEEVLFAGRNAGLSRAEANGEAESTLHRLRLSHLKGLPWRRLSAGYRMRFELALALMSRPRLLLLDEPLAPLDMIAKEELLEDLRALADTPSRAMAIALTSQELYDVEAVANVVLFLRDGSPAFYGPPTELGRNRAIDAIELGGDFTPAALTAAVERLGCVAVEPVGVNTIVRFARPLMLLKLCGALHEAGLDVRYMRDVGRSSREFFEGE